MRHAGPGCGEARHLGGRHEHGMGQPNVITEPPEVGGVLDRAFPELLHREALFVGGLGKMGMEPHAALARQRSRVAHQFRRDAEGRAWGHHHAAHRARRGVVEGIDRPGGVLENHIGGLDHRVGGQPAVFDRQTHRAARGMEAESDLGSRGNFIVEF